MSNKTRLQTNNTNLQALITKANTLPDAGGGSSGGSVETCTVKILNNITSLGHKIGGLGYSYLDDAGNISATYSGNNNTQTEIILENVICGSLLYLFNFGYDFVGYTLSGGIIDLDNLSPGQYFRAPTENGVIGVISIEDWD